MHSLLQARLAAGRRVRVGLIEAGKFGTMFLNQVPTTPGLEVAAIADLSSDRILDQLCSAGWEDADYCRVGIFDDGMDVARHPEVEVVIEATGSPEAGIRHVRAAIAAGKHVVMVTVEADALAGPLLAKEADEAGVVYPIAHSTPASSRPARRGGWRVPRPRRTRSRLSGSAAVKKRPPVGARFRSVDPWGPTVARCCARRRSLALGSCSGEPG